MTIKASLDPRGLLLSSWNASAVGDSRSPCGSSAFEGVACNEHGYVTNISLQGKGLSGEIPAALGELKNLTGLYLHFNFLHGEIPEEIAGLSELTDLYLNVNSLSGIVPPKLGNMSNLQVLDLCCNRLSGNIPMQLGSLQKLSVLSLQYNQLTGAIPATLGDLGGLTRLDLSFNSLFSSIPVKLANAPALQVLDVRNNTLSGKVPSALERLGDRFIYRNNPGLCGEGFSILKVCPFPDSSSTNKPEPIEAGSNVSKPEKLHPSPSSSKSPQGFALLGAIGAILASTTIGLFTFSWYRRRKQRIGFSLENPEGPTNTDQTKEVCRRRSSPLISLEYPSGWDPLTKGQNWNEVSQEVLKGFMFNLEDVESATQHFSEVNLLGKGSFSSIYKGILRDGSVVVVKCIAKTSCKSDESEFVKGLKILTSLKHDNLVRLRGFCCSKGRGECFLVYDFVPNENLLQYLDVKSDSSKVLNWSARLSIINGIAKGIAYLHGNKGKKPALVHQNLSAEKVLIDLQYNPLLSDSGLHKLLADDVVFAMLKSCAAMGYLAPEYTTTGRFTEKSDIYAFGMIIFQVLSGRRRISSLTRQAVELCKLEDFIDPNLEGKFSEAEATKLGEIALLCTHESPSQRPAILDVILELTDLTNES